MGTHTIVTEAVHRVALKALPGVNIQQLIYDEIRKAIEDERERCAKVAEDFKNIGGNAVSRQYCDSIAECIRRGT